MIFDLVKYPQTGVLNHMTPLLFSFPNEINFVILIFFTIEKLTLYFLLWTLQLGVSVLLLCYNRFYMVNKEQRLRFT